ncbi:MAG: restriction endonuclease [Chloroflexi bacterium]|nr:restriction endonuclease [Chloroflexota bacterium]
MRFPTLPLDRVCDFLDHHRVPVKESERKPGPYPYYGANGQQGWIDGFIFDEPLVLLAEDGGHFGSQTRPIAYKIVDKSWVNNHAHVLRPKPNIDIDYLHRVLSFYDVSKFVTGTTRLKLTKAKAADMPIPLPPLVEQQRIAGILGRADRLRRLRRYALELSEGYLQAVFLEMFGDTILNPRDWNFKELDEVADIASGVTKGQRFNGKKTVLVPYLRVANVQDGYLDLSEIKSIEALPTAVEKLRLKYGDIVMTEGGDFDKLGRGAIWEGQLKECIHQNHIFRVRLNRNYVLPNYFAILLLTRYTKSYFLRASKQTTNLATINMTQLKAYQVPVPPIKLQQQVVEVSRQNKRLRSQQREALRQAEHLFQALLQRAFRGEL